MSSTRRTLCRLGRECLSGGANVARLCVAATVRSTMLCNGASDRWLVAGRQRAWRQWDSVAVCPWPRGCVAVRLPQGSCAPTICRGWTNGGRVIGDRTTRFCHELAGRSCEKSVSRTDRLVLIVQCSLTISRPADWLTPPPPPPPAVPPLPRLFPTSYSPQTERSALNTWAHMQTTFSHKRR